MSKFSINEHTLWSLMKSLYWLAVQPAEPAVIQHAQTSVCTGLMNKLIIILSDTKHICFKGTAGKNKVYKYLRENVSELSLWS